MPFTVIRDRHGITSKLIALTFDDGPSEWTEPILQHLRSEGSRATFFVVGAELEGREEIVLRTAFDGHELGVHTFTHPDLCTLTDDEVLHEIASAAKALARITGAGARFWRPPYFRWDERVARLACEAGFCELVHCSIDPSDWHSEATVDGVADAVLREFETGSIIDLHDTTEVTVEAVARLLPELEARGFQAVTLSELLAAD